MQICGAASAASVPAANLGKEDVFQVGAAWQETSIERRLTQHVQERAAPHEPVGNDFVALLENGKLSLLDGALPNAALQLCNSSFRFSLKEHFALMNDGHVGAEIHHILDDVRREDDDYLLADLRKQIVEAVALAGIEAGSRLIHNEQLRTAQQSLRDPETLPHAARITGQGFLAVVVKVAAPQHRLHQLLSLLAVDYTFQQRDVIQHVERRDTRINAKILWQIPEPAPDFFLLLQHVDVPKRCRPAVWFLQ